MRPTSSTGLSALHTYIPLLAGMAALLLGSLVLAGWFFDSTVLKSGSPLLTSMKINAAVTFVLLGVTLTLLQKSSQTVNTRSAARGCATLVILIASATVAEYLTGKDLGIDQWLKAEPSGTVGTPYPGRMGMSTALCFLLLGSALWFTTIDVRWAKYGAQGLVLAGLFAAFTTLLGYTYHLEFFSPFASYTQMSFYTSLGLLAVGAGILSLNPAFGVMETLLGSHLGSRTARRLLPAAIAVVPIVAWAKLTGEQAGLFDHKFGTAFAVAVNVVFLGAMVLWTARYLNAADRGRQQSERFFTTFMHNLPALAWIKDLQGRYVYCNKAFQDSFHAHSDAWHGKTDQEVLPSATAEQFQANDAQVIATERSLLTLETAPYGDGLHQSVVSKFPLFNEEGTLTQVGGVAIDMTERKQAEQALQDSERRFRTIFDQAGVGMAVTDLQGRYVKVNKSYCDLVGYSEEELTARTFKDITHPDDPSQTWLIRNDTLSEPPHVYRFEKRYVHKAGYTVWVEMTASVVLDDGGAPCYLVGQAQDITERKQIKEALQLAHEELERRVEERTVALRESQQRLELAFLGAGLASWDWDVESGAVKFNERWAELRGFSLAEVEPHVSSCLNGIHPDDRSRVEQVINDCLVGNLVDFETEMRVRTKAGEWTWILDRGRVIERDAQGAPKRMAGIEIDITGSKRAQQALQESEERYSSLVSQATDIIYTAGIDGRFTYVNAAACTSMGYQEQELLGRHYLELIRPDYREAAQQCYKQQLREGVSSSYFEFPAVTRDGREIWLGQRVQLRLSHGQTVGVEAIARDITERKRTEGALRGAYDRLQVVTRRLTKAEESERRRIARELHDEFGQALTGLKFDVAWLKKGLSRMKGSVDTAAVQSKIAAMSQSVDGLIKSIRDTAAALRPSVLDDLGLVAAVEWLATSFRDRTGLPCEVTIDPAIQESIIAPEVATTVFRSAQELLTNVMRHAQASAVSVRLTEHEGCLELFVRDDGRGIRAREWEQGRALGLRGVQERVKLIGGTIIIAGSSGTGTEVSVRLPVEGRSLQAAKEQV